MFYLTTCLHRSPVNTDGKDFSGLSNPYAFPGMLGFISLPPNKLGQPLTLFHEPCHEFCGFFSHVEPELFCWNLKYRAIGYLTVGEQIIYSLSFDNNPFIHLKIIIIKCGMFLLTG